MTTNIMTVSDFFLGDLGYVLTLSACVWAISTLITTGLMPTVVCITQTSPVHADFTTYVPKLLLGTTLSTLRQREAHSGCKFKFYHLLSS